MCCYFIFAVVFLFLILPIFFYGTKIISFYNSVNRFYCFKYLLLVLVLKFRKIQNKYNKHESNQAGYGVKSFKSIANMDCVQVLSNYEQAIDAVYMNAANKFGWHFIAGVVRQNNGIVNSLFYLKVPGIGLLQAPKLPDTFYVLPKDKVGTFSTNYLTFVPIQAMTLWKVSYRGPMRLLGDSKRKFNVKLEATFKSKLKVFDFDVDMKDNSIIKSISCEPWSISYFKRLKDYHQTHYEQHGELNGSVSIDGVHFDLLLNCMRDHSYGRRDWTLFHRYILHIFTLEDGTKGNVGIVCAPSMFTRLEIGYIYSRNGTLLPLESIDLSFYQHGEAGTPPLDYAFTFKAGGETYLVQVIVKESAEFYYGNNWEARIVENLCRFVVNGIEGWGATEWQYRNYTSMRTEIKPGYRKDQDIEQEVEL